MKPMRMSRRHFLAALGTTGALLGVRGARGAAVESTGVPARTPRRFIAVYTPHGRAYELWRPGEGFDLRFPDSTLAPFDDPATYGRSFRDRLLVIDGIDLTAGIAVGTSGHDGPRVILTGSGADGKGPSLDQFLAEGRGLGQGTLFTSVVLGVGTAQPGNGSSISYGEGGVPLPKWIDPAQTFAELFGAALAGDKRDALEEERRVGRSVLDASRAELARLAAQAPAAERAKMEQHAAALRDIEKRLAGAARACAPPVAEDRVHFAHTGSYDGGATSLDAITDLQIDLLARAMSCDITRFATLMLGDLSRTRLYPELPDDVHEGVAHRYDAAEPRERHPGTPSTWRALAIQNRYSYGKVARLLAKLDEAGVLDETLVLVSGDMGDPARHLSRDVPTLLAGGAGGAFAMGRMIDLNRGKPAGAPGVPNNRLLVSIARAFGAPVDRFGQCADPAVVTGHLEGLA